ncbi:MAG: hypothetical protein IKM05_04020, partial [Clostridia bacterium]|nr:hypothetical protein [Clostridia bacterium]
SQQTGAHKPVQPAAPQSQGTQAYHPPVQQADKAPASAIQQEMAKTTAYQPQNGQMPPAPAPNGQQPPRRRRSDKYNT